MRRVLVSTSISVCAVVAAALTAAAPTVATASSSAAAAHRYKHVCDAPADGMAACNAIVQDDSADGSASPDGSASSDNSAAPGNSANPNSHRPPPPPPPPTTPNGFGPAALQGAYNLPSSSAGTGQTVAVVDAYDDPNAENDLAVYRSQFGLVACTTANGCFRKVSQSGSSSRLPQANGGWAQEESLDVDMVSAICPNCHILLVEASSASFTNLGLAENEAVQLGAKEISNSYGGSDSSSDSTFDSYYNHPGVAITASTGDGGYGVEYPAASPYVTAVGGTSLTYSGSVRSESVWSTSSSEGAGSGCSAYEPRPSWQTSNTVIPGVCAKRAVADVSAVADPATGVAVYDSFSSGGLSGWLVFGGTSVASPIIASVYALAGNAASVTSGSYPYSHTASLNDVTVGKTANCGSALCAAGTGWDGPTGLGTPNGTSAF